MKNKNYYSLLWVLISASLILTSCVKDDLMTPRDENVNLSPEKSLKCNSDDDFVPPGKTVLLTKRTWTFGEVFHEDPAIQEVLEGVFTGLEFKFNKNGSYHIVIPVIGRDDTGTWEFIDGGSKILFDKGTVGEHFITILTLKSRKLNYTFDDPALGPWELHLIPL